MLECIHKIISICSCITICVCIIYDYVSMCHVYFELNVFDEHTYTL